MSVTFVDTSFLLALVLQDDAMHGRAVAWQRSLIGSLVTTEFVLLETLNSLSLPSVRKYAVGIYSLISGAENTVVIPASDRLFRQGWELFSQRMDKGWSLTDCISFNIMTEREIMNVLTHDHHFQQAGFRPLLREDPPSN